MSPFLWENGRMPAAYVSGANFLSGQVSRGSAGEYQSDEQAGVAWLSWGVSGR